MYQIYSYWMLLVPWYPFINTFPNLSFPRAHNPTCYQRYRPRLGSFLWGSLSDHLGRRLEAIAAGDILGVPWWYQAPSGGTPHGGPPRVGHVGPIFGIRQTHGSCQADLFVGQHVPLDHWLLVCCSSLVSWQWQWCKCHASNWVREVCCSNQSVCCSVLDEALEVFLARCCTGTGWPSDRRNHSSFR